MTRKIYGGAKALTAADAFKGFYALQAYKKKLAPVIASVDVICVPTAPTHYTVADLKKEPIRENSRLGTYTNFVNLLDMCGIAVPCPWASGAIGLPASITLLASAGRDALAGTLAREIHATSGLPLGATGWLLPPHQPVSAPPEGIPLVVVGAHLSGMPLNAQLTSCGAVFDRAVMTTADYQLFSLPGQEVPKPGLVRSGNGEGVAIEAEVWRLAPEAFARFVNAVPAPLSVGTIALADGTALGGFSSSRRGSPGAGRTYRAMAGGFCRRTAGSGRLGRQRRAPKSRIAIRRP